ncbi:hypothetical protein OG323_28200 [Streptomyces cyaneofuscatus]|nr:hypothetical protein OG323_28200 [Streptomyces cyaneofuscatus]
MSEPESRRAGPGLEFFTGFVVSGTVGGADATSTPGEVTAILGDGTWRA